MRATHVRWPVISFLELFCCALGAGVILLVMISHDIQESVTTTRMLRVAVQAQLPGEGVPRLSMTRVAPRHDDAVTITGEKRLAPATGYNTVVAAAAKSKLWADGDLRESNKGASLFFLCDASGRTGRYVLRLTHDRAAGLPPTAVRDDKDLAQRRNDLKARLAAGPGAAARNENRRQLLANLADELAGKPGALASLASPGDEASLWYRVFERVPPADPSVPAFLAASRDRDVKNGERTVDLMTRAVTYTLLALKSGGGVATLERDVLLAFADQSNDQLDKLWSDLLVFLSLHCPPTDRPRQLRLGSGAATMLDPARLGSRKFGQFVRQRQGTPRPIATPADVQAILAEPRPSDELVLNAYWLDVADKICQPRDLKIAIDWGSDGYDLTLGGDALRPTYDGGGRATYEVAIELKVDAVLVNGRPAQRRPPAGGQRGPR